MKKLFLLTTTLAIALMSYAGVQVNTVFSMAGNEKNASVTADGVTNGIPVTTFKSLHNTIAGEAAADPSFHKNNYISVGNKYSDSDPAPIGRNMIIGELSNYALPFASKLNDCDADSIVWTFNMRYNYDYTGGFDVGQRGIATVLVMDNADLQLGNGYAVVNMKTKEYALVKIKNGLSATNNVTKLLTVATETNKKYMTFRVVYVPQTDVWRFYSNEGGEFADPLTATYTKVGEVVDATYTGSTMTHFGFLNSYSGKGNYQTLLARNFMVRAYKSIPNAIEVYSNPFCSTTSTQLNNTESGTPAVLFTNQQVLGAGDAPAVPTTNIFFLQIQNKKFAGAKGKNILTAPIANFAAPFTSKLSEIQADSVVWTFNFRNNNLYSSKGFDDGMMGYANVLVADNADLTQGNGYAVIMGKKSGNNGDKHIYLARYTEGLDANVNVTTILQTPECTLQKYWSIRVTYIPASNTWKMAWYEDQTKFVAPAAVTDWTDCGSAVDDTYTSNEMTTFGFLNNYNGNNDGIMYVQNYYVTAYNQPEAEQQPVTMFTYSFTAQNPTPMDGHSGGTPKATFSQTTYNYGTAADAPVPTIQGELLISGTKADNSKGRNILTAPMRGFASPFNSKLDQIDADSLVWMFNMRYNYDYTSSFANENRAIATVLAMDNNNLLAGNGYAVVNNESKYYKLVRVTNGLNSDDHLEVLAKTPQLGSNKNYMTFRVVYIPTTHLWKFYYVAAASYIKPQEAEFIYVGSKEDDTFTSTDMTTFGFMNNYLQGSTYYVTMGVRSFSFSAYTQHVVIDEQCNNDAYLNAFAKQTTDVELHRNLKAGSWNTICLPFALSAAQIEEAFGTDCQIVQFSGAEMAGETLNLNFDPVSQIEAGYPYLIQPNQDITDPMTIEDVTIVKLPKMYDFGLATMEGVFSPTTLEASKNTLFLGAENTLYYVSEESDLPGLRAYFTLTDAAAKAARHCVKIGSAVTDLRVLPSTTNIHVTKRIVNGQFIIEREGVKYNAEGVRLQ